MLKRVGLRCEWSAARGPRILRITLPHVHAWNSWYSWYGNTAEGFASLSAKLDGDFRRSACVLVALEGGAGERNVEEGSAPVGARRLREHLGALANAGPMRRSSSSTRSTNDPSQPSRISFTRRDVPVATVLNPARSPLARALNAQI
jgi:hypothetical protein